MKTLSRTLLAAASVLLATQVAAQATFYEHENFAGRSLNAIQQVPSFGQYGFNDRSSSVTIVGERWEICQDDGYQGTCTVLREGRYASLAAMGLNDRISSARVLSRDARSRNDRYESAPVTPQITFFQREGFEGRSFTTTGRVANFRRAGFNDRASSAVVIGERWEVCDNLRFRGQCTVLRPGRYPSLAAMGLNDRITSVRAVDHDARIADRRYAPEPMPVYDSRRRDGERLYEANITSSRAVLATSGQRCWVESTQVPQAQRSTNVPAAIAGALIGGILGHQVGGGTGKDIATVGGVVAGAAIGAQVGRDGQPLTQDVQRCENVPGGAQPAYWDVSYNFRGQDHRIQMAVAPGATVTVNEQGEPRQ